MYLSCDSISALRLIHLFQFYFLYLPFFTINHKQHSVKVNLIQFQARLRQLFETIIGKSETTPKKTRLRKL